MLVLQFLRVFSQRRQIHAICFREADAESFHSREVGGSGIAKRAQFLQNLFDGHGNITVIQYALKGRNMKEQGVALSY